MKEPKEITILIVDDQEIMRDLIKSSLRKMGFSTLMEAEDGEAALEILKEREVGICISDWRMPGMSGLDLFKASLEIPDHKPIPFLMLTGEKSVDKIRDAIVEGIKYYIVKPYTFNILQEKMNEIMVNEIK